MIVDIEKKKSVFRFQHQIYDLENNRFEVLEHDQFVKELGDYLLQLYRLNHRDVVVRVIEKLGECTSSIKMVQRERALSILYTFSEHIDRNDGEIVIDTLSSSLVQKESEF